MDDAAMDIRALRGPSDLAWAVTEIAAYFEREPEPGSAGAERFDILAALIAEYEAREVPVPDADPIDVLRYAIDELGRSQSELAELLGSRSRASEILARRRPLTLDMIRTISATWNLPAAALLEPYPLREAGACI